MDKMVFPRVPWLLAPYAALLSTTIDDLLQVDVLDDDYPPPLYASRAQYDDEGLHGRIACAYAAGIPTREELLHFHKNQLAPLEGGAVYLDIPDRKQLGRILLYVDDDLWVEGSTFDAWATISFLQKSLGPDTVLGGDPDMMLGFFEAFARQNEKISLLICDHNLGWPGNDSHPPFPTGCEFVHELKRRDYEIPPIILHSDKALIPFGWENIGEYRLFAPKYDNYSGKPYRDYLLESIIMILSE